MRQGARAAVAGTLSIALGSLTTLGAFADDGDVRDLAPPPRAVGSAAPVPHPSPAKRRRRRGRTTFGLTGAATVADRVAPGAGTTADVSNVLGLEARLEHRAEGWGFVGTLPATVALHGGRLGEPDASLVSRRFALFYRNEQLAPFGQLPAGSLPRAYGVVTRVHDTDLTAFAGNAPADGDSTYRVEGVEAKRAFGRAAASLTLVAGQAEGAAGRLFSAVVGFATAPGRVDATVETALSWTRAMASTPDGSGALSYQARVNAGSPGGYASYIERFVAPSFAEVGGQAEPEAYHALAYHLNGRTSIDLSLVRESHPATATAAASDDTRATAAFRRHVGAGDAAVSISAERSDVADVPQWNDGLNASYGIALGRGAYAALSAALQRQQSGVAAPGSTVQFDARVAAALGRGTRAE
ncbi:MAG: hypothetical protein JOZ24_05320, partial [Candidatus Eremiobacteraeota bacterium]|nr:hypothetical protein [Candidatus Eremiobacteraeota bacterium]